MFLVSKIVFAIKKILKSLVRLFLLVCSMVFPDLACIIRFIDEFGKIPNLVNPKTFNEKILLKILFDRNPKLTLAADKYLVREFVKSRLGGTQYLNRIYAVVDSPNKICNLSLPNQFVMKPNHLSRQIKIARDSEKLECGELEKLAAIWLQQNYYNDWNEWAYKNIKPCIIFEELLEIDGIIPNDYKFFCFNGEPRFIQVDKDRFTQHRRNIYDSTFSLLPIKFGYENFQDKIDIPQNFDKMLEIARKLSAGFDFIRVDLYNLKGRIIFGELTNYPDGGLAKFEPSLWDIKFGNYWK